MPATRSLLVAAVVAIGAAVMVPLSASAHALPQSAVPAEGSEVEVAPRVVEITFGEAPDPRLSTITVVDSSGASVTAGPTAVVPGHPTELQVPLRSIGNGVYTVTWKTVSEVDGHLATGAYAFGVGVSAASASAHASASVASPPPSVLAVVARWLFYIGVMGMIGVVSTCLIALRDIPGFALRTLGVTWVLAALGIAGIIEAEREAAAVSVGSLLSTSIGAVALARVIAWVATGVAVAAAMFGPAAFVRLGVALAGIGAAAAAWIDVAASHAGAQAPVAANLIIQWLHIVAASVWIGGLLILLLAVRGQASQAKAGAVRRFSTTAGFAIVVVALTGTFRAVIEIGSIGQLFGSAFGVLVLVKVGLLIILACLGAINRFRNVPRAPAILRGLRRVGSTEVVIGTAAVVIAAALVNVAPPLASAAAAATVQARQLVVTGSDFATTVKARLTISPGTPGFNEYSLRVTDFDTGATVRATSVQLEFAQPLRPQLGVSTLTLTRQRDGSFAARGSNMSIAGIWEVAVIVDNADRSTEVHLQVTTVTPPPLVTATRFRGLPTLYSVRLQNGWIAQVYLDPDKAGSDEFHVTFFTNSNESSEIQIASATFGMTIPGSTPTILVSRRLDPIGHFVSDATVPAAATRFDILATTATGQPIASYLVITPGS